MKLTEEWQFISAKGRLEIGRMALVVRKGKNEIVELTQKDVEGVSGITVLCYVKKIKNGGETMKQIMQTGVTMTSLELAEITGKEHKNVMRDIQNEIESLEKEGEIGQLIFEPSSYKNSQSKEQPMYTFGKEGAMQIAMRYSAVIRRKVIIRLNELESKLSAPTSYKEAVQHLMMQLEENEKLQIENKQKDQIIGELKPKADYVDRILQSKSLVTITQIAKDYGMSGEALNKKLHELGVQYKQGEQWLLYSKYHGQGYTHSETFDFKRTSGMSDVKMNTKWTQKGRLFLYNLLKDEGVVPVIERVCNKEAI